MLMLNAKKFRNQFLAGKLARERFRIGPASHIGAGLAARQ
jgi:hypothetical protein